MPGMRPGLPAATCSAARQAARPLQRQHQGHPLQRMLPVQGMPCQGRSCGLLQGMPQEQHALQVVHHLLGPAAAGARPRRAAVLLQQAGVSLTA